MIEFIKVLPHSAWAIARKLLVAFSSFAILFGSPIMANFWFPDFYQDEGELREGLRLYHIGLQREIPSLERFTEREQIHLQDTRALLIHLYAVLLISLCSLILSYLLDRRTFSIGLRIGAWIALGVTTLFVVGSIIDPIRTSESFHEALFNNEFWRLDPRRRLLARLHPPAYWVLRVPVVLFLSLGGSLTVLYKMRQRESL